ncbi:MAG: hypothetical protein IT436_05490 [Phycisphaerales bacterium]|nr:hypothetical protein [Phycisphaerales bacterium]
MKRIHVNSGSLRVWLAAIVSVGVAAAAGCNIIGPAFVMFSPPPTIKAEYTLDPKRPTIVFIDDRSNRLPRRSLRQVIADEAQRVLLDKKCVETLIDSKAGVAAASADRSGEPLPIVEIGRAAKADIVIYVTIDSFTLSPDGATYSPTSAFRAKVLDARDEQRLWPDDAAGHAVALQPVQRPDFTPRNNSEMLKAEVELAKRTGMAVGQLFTKHLVERSAVEGK